MPATRSRRASRTSPAAADAPAATPPQAEPLGKRARTREQLLDAALAIVAQGGLQDVAILTLAKAAGVSNGTFYNHFRTREDLLEAVALRMAESLATELRPLLLHASDPAARVALATGRFMSKARRDRDFGWALLRLHGSHGAMSGLIRQYILTDLRDGERLGCFHYVSETAALDLLLGTLLAGIRSTLEGEVPPEHPAHVAEVTLRGLGVQPAQARRLSQLALT